MTLAKSLSPTLKTALFADIKALKSITDPNQPYTRRAFTEYYQAGRAYLIEQLQQIGLTPYIDSAGNLRARLQGDSDRTIYIGSHTDTVPGGGLLDGVLGVLAALTILRYFTKAQIKPQYSIELIDFLAEETSDWGVSCIGSRGITGEMSDAYLSRLHPITEESLAEAIIRMGGDPAHLPKNPPFNHDNYFLELHIEQGPLLEKMQKKIGLVTDIVGIERIKIHFKGLSNHAGTTPMTLRQDALVAAAKMIVATHDIAYQLSKEATIQGGSFVATCGSIDNYPNAMNVIPGDTTIMVEMRATDLQFFTLFKERLQLSLEQLNFPYNWEVMTDTHPIPMDTSLLNLSESLVQKLQIPYQKMASGAGHDAAFMANIAKTAMIFIPSIAGISHNAQEASYEEDIVCGVELLLALTIKLALRES